METITKTTKHFEFTGETKRLGIGITLHRIRATVKTIHANIGDIGGWVEKPDNLCDNAWVSDDACVFGNACVSGNARISGFAQVFDDSSVSRAAQVSGNACVSGHTCVSGFAKVFGNACVCDDACVFGNARVSGNARISGFAQISGTTFMFGEAFISGDARVSSDNDHCGFDSFGFFDRHTHAYNRHTHAYQTTNGIEITYGSFRGSLDEYADRIKDIYSNSEYEKQYELIIRLIKLKFNLPE